MNEWATALFREFIISLVIPSFIAVFETFCKGVFDSDLVVSSDKKQEDSIFLFGANEKSRSLSKERAFSSVVTRCHGAKCSYRKSTDVNVSKAIQKPGVVLRDVEKSDRSIQSSLSINGVCSSEGAR